MYGVDELLEEKVLRGTEQIMGTEAVGHWLDILALWEKMAEFRDTSAEGDVEAIGKLLDKCVSLALARSARLSGAACTRDQAAMCGEHWGADEPWLMCEPCRARVEVDMPADEGLGIDS